MPRAVSTAPAPVHWNFTPDSSKQAPPAPHHLPGEVVHEMEKNSEVLGGYVAILLGTAIFVMSWLAKLLKVLTNHRNPTLGWVRGES